MKRWKIIGLMSGSSLDGLDIAYCEFSESGGKWHYKILEAETMPYPAHWQDILENIRKATAQELVCFHNDYGKFLGETTLQFIKKHSLSPDLIASHGHTVFHNPAEGYTFQMGNGQAIANITNVKTVADFRTGDILLGGQGAPLVPIGDKLLFNEYSACLNIGGISNITFKDCENTQAFDICPANQLLNRVAGQLGMKYDKDGNVASLGKLDKKLLQVLENDDYYRKKFPKSLSNEYVQDNFMKAIDIFELPVEDKLHTVTIHIAEKIAESFNLIHAEKALITGGGAKNRFLIKKIRERTRTEIVIPDDKLIGFKESLIFAFMGLLKIQNKVNCLSSVTGAVRDSSSGVIFQP